MPKPFAILRVEKRKNFGDITRSQKHNFREQPTPNARSGAPAPELIFGARDLVGVLHEKLDHVKRRKDAVLAFELVLTASPSFFSTATETEKKRWIEANTAFLQNRFSTNLLQIVAHRDEATDHLHAYCSAFTPEGKLAYSELLGTPEKMRQLQTDYAKAMKPFGLRRGLAKAKTQREHQTLTKRLDVLEESFNTISKGLKELAEHVHSLAGMKVLGDMLAALLPAFNMPLQASASDSEPTPPPLMPRPPAINQSRLGVPSPR